MRRYEAPIPKESRIAQFNTGNQLCSAFPSAAFQCDVVAHVAQNRLVFSRAVPPCVNRTGFSKLDSLLREACSRFSELHDVGWARCHV
jgi:hypothetical protein